MNKLQQEINTYIQKNSNFDTHRDYLGISKISGCPTRVYDEFKNGTTASEQTYRMCYAGYEQERLIFNMLNKIGFARLPSIEHREVVAPFDNRLRGHIDAETYNGDLLEIKSVSTFKFQKIIRAGTALDNHMVQVQLYMLYGWWKRTIIVYRCRETYEHFIAEVLFNPGDAGNYEVRAGNILRSIDDNKKPMCECGHCKQEQP